MAQVILSSLLDGILGDLGSAALQKLQLMWGFDPEKELQNLQSKLSTIHAVLEDAEGRQFESKAVEDWLLKLKHAAYDAEDLVDEIVTEAQQSKIAETGIEEAGKKRKRKVCDYFPSLFNSAQPDMAGRIIVISQRFDRIEDERRGLHLETRDRNKQIEIIAGRQQLVSSVRDESSHIFGREDDTEQAIKSLLSDDSGKRNFSVIAIVGMGGVGKTTLAQVVYNDKRVVENFNLTAWACVSEQFDIQRLTKEIISSASKSTCDLSGMDTLQCQLRDMLKGQKFFIVLDDVWSENYNDWERLQAPFTSGAKGSKIVVTTRNQAVSNVMQATCTHSLKGLSKQDCRSLFICHAFSDDNADAYPELIEIGEELVDKCGGLPLAAKALGGLLSCKREVKEWESILRSPLWDLRGAASEILPVLRLSYQHLPAPLKRCFTFCSIFPKDHAFYREELVQMWVAHGFVCPEDGKQIEDTGSEYFNDLVLRSFFQPHYYDEGKEIEPAALKYFYFNEFDMTSFPISWDGTFRMGTSYKMHDLFHDLAQFISGDECFQMEHVKPNGVLRKIRHLLYNQGSVNFQSFYELKGLRTVLPIQQYSYMSQQVPHEMFVRLRFIRVLDLSFIRIRELPDSIGGLQHLRYLNLRGTDIKELPESICNIYNLQTLLLHGCQNLVELPSETRKLINLRHLDLGCNNIVSMPPQLGRLIFLRTLPLFVAGKVKERGIAELKELTNIHGKLVIRNLEKVVEAEEAREANLKNKPFIEELSLMWKEDSDCALRNILLEAEVADGLKPHSNLKALAFSGYMGAHFPSWMLNIDLLLPNVKVLHLINCKRCNLLPPLGRLPSLSRLTVTGMDEVKKIESMYGGMVDGFPSLRVLLLRNMSSLEQWQENERGFPCLQRLQIINCPQLRQMPNCLFPNLTALQICSCAMLVALPRLPSLKQLVLDELHNLEEWCDVGEAHFPHLQRLKIRNCPKMRRWPSILPVITELAVILCAGLDALPLLPSLCKLELWADASMLNSVPYLTCLSSLTIHAIPRVTPMPQVTLQTLTQLKDLEIWGCEEPVTLQDESLPLSLTSLSFSRCFDLESLPKGLNSLTSLHTLKITTCPRLASLPEEGLPPALQRLEIYNCPLLKKRCLRDGGEDWPKISHIPRVQIKDL